MLNKKILFSLLLLLPGFMLAQKVKLSPDKAYIATYFANKKDSVIFVRERSDLKETLATFAKYRIVVYSKSTGKELHSYETRLFRLQNGESNIRFGFKPENNDLFVGLENEQVLRFDIKKGLIAKYKAFDFAFNSDYTETALLQTNRIFFINSQKEIKRKFDSFKNLRFTPDNKFIVASRKARSYNYYVFTEIENPDNKEMLKGAAIFYNTEEETITALNTKTINTFKTSNFKEKEKDLDQRFTKYQYKQNIFESRFSPSGEKFFMISDIYISVLENKGKHLTDIKIDDDFVLCSWENENTLKIISRKSVKYYNLLNESIGDEVNLKLNTSAFAGNKIEAENISQDDKYFAINGNNSFILKNTLGKKEKVFDNKQFIAFSESGEEFFTLDNRYQISVYETSKAFDSDQSMSLKTDRILMLSTLGNSVFASVAEQKYYSPDLNYLATTFSDVEIDKISHPSGEKLEEVYQKLMNDRKKPDLQIVYKANYINAFTLFHINDLIAENITTDKINYEFISFEVDTNFFINEVAQEKFRAKKKRILAREYFALKGGKAASGNIPDKKIDDLRLTNSHTYIVKTNSSRRYKIVDILKNEELNHLPIGDAYFSPDNEFIVVPAALKTILFNGITGKAIRSYKKIYSHILLTNNQSFFIGKNKTDNFEFVGTNKQVDLNSSIAAISGNGKFLITVSKNKTACTLYALPELNKISESKLSEEFKRFFYNPQIELSETGDYFSCQYKNELLLLSCKHENTPENSVLIDNVSETDAAFWLNQNNILISRAESSALLNAKTGSFTSERNFDFYFNSSEINYLKSMNQKTYISSDNEFAAIQFSENGQNYLYLKYTKNKYKNHLITNAEFVAFAENSSKVFFKRGNNKIGFVNTKELKNPKINYLSVNTIRAPRRNNRSLPPRPSMIEHDFEPPEGYRYERFTEKKSIDEINNDTLGVYAHNLSSDGNSVNLNLHLLNQEGVYYSSSDKEKNKDIWCDLWIKYPNGKVKRVENFSVNEKNSETDAQNIAFALVLDHSGSMGETRCIYQQKGAKNFIEHKRNNDAISVIKFDENVDTEVGLNTTKSFLLNGFKVMGEKGFGGSTALYDAIYAGISEVIKSKDKNARKAVMVITDGYENSSYTYLNELIVFALENNVEIHTVGFGAYVNKAKLQAIAYQTGGNFYEIYKTDNFSWIFDDVFNKLTNHYTLNFATPQKGKYTVMLKPCSDKIKNNVVVAFDNDEIKFKDVIEYDDDGFGIPFIDLSDSIDISTFEKPEPIPNITKIVSKNGSNLDFYTQNEFDNIKFPDIKFITDKTVIVKGTDEGLDDVIIFLKKHSKIIIEISGHTDEVGTGENNMSLSDRRAKRIKEIIVNGGVNPDRILTVGYGETKPIATNKTKEGKLKNRRVEFKIIK